MRIITIEIFNDEEAEEAFSIIDQGLSDALILANITLNYEGEERIADGGTSRVPPETQ